MWHGMVRYVSKHRNNLGMLGSVVEHLRALRKRLNAFRAFRERVGSFSRLGRPGSIKPYGMVGYAMYACKHKQEKLGMFASFLERIEAFGRRLKVLRALWERMEAFGMPGRLVNCMYGNM